MFSPLCFNSVLFPLLLEQCYLMQYLFGLYFPALLHAYKQVLVTVGCQITTGSWSSISSFLSSASYHYFH